MDNLPREIFDHIISLVGEVASPLAPLASVSRRFQMEVEKRTFSFIQIRTTDKEIDNFERIWNPQRRLYLRTLIIHLFVPYSQGEYHRMSFEYDEADIRKATASLRRLWNFLSSASSETALNRGNVALGLKNTFFLNENGYHPSLPLNLTAEVESFPALPFVGEFIIFKGSSQWHPRMPVLFTSCMPNLKLVQWRLDTSEWNWSRYYSIDKKCRSELVQTIEANRLPASMKNFRCKLNRPAIYTTTQPLPRFIENNTPDPFSLAIRKLTRHCDNIYLTGSFDPSLFDPPKSEPEAEEQPCWQSTTRLRIKMALHYPDGTWLLRPQETGDSENIHEGLINCTQLPPGCGDTREEREAAFKYFNDHFETLSGFVPPSPKRELIFIPDDEKLNELLTAIARCCVRMPALNIARVDFGIREHLWYDGIVKDRLPMVTCIAPFLDPPFNINGMRRSSLWSVYLYVGDWRPTAATVAELKRIGLKKDGRPSIIAYI